MQNIARGAGLREQYSTRLRLVLYCSLDPVPRAIFCIQHSIPCYNYMYYINNCGTLYLLYSSHIWTMRS